MTTAASRPGDAVVLLGGAIAVRGIASTRIGFLTFDCRYSRMGVPLRPPGCSCGLA